MNCRALRNHRLRNRAWAVVAALLTSTESRSMEWQDVPPTSQPSTTSIGVSENHESVESQSNRLQIAAPRRFSAAELQGRGATPPAARPKIPPPRQFVIPSSVQQPPAAALAAQPEGQAPEKQAGDSPVWPLSSTGLAATTENAPASPVVDAPLTGQTASSQAHPSSTLAPVSDAATIHVQKNTGASVAGTKNPIDESQFTPHGPASSPEPTRAAMPATVQQALATLSQPPAADSAVSASPAQALEFQPKHADEADFTDHPAEKTLAVTSTVSGTPDPAAAETAQVPAAEQAAATPAQAPTTNPVTVGELTLDSPPVNDPVSKPTSEMSQTARPVPSRLSDKTVADRSDDRQVERTMCTTCGGFHSSLDGPRLHGCLTCGGQNCVPGQKPCNLPANDCNTVFGAFLVNLYQEICCPDPCYQPRWDPAAYASFFADYARPRTVTRIRYDNLEAMTRPDRNQFFLNNVTPVRTNNTRPIGNLFARLQQAYLYQEAAGERGSFFVEIPYRQINESWAPTQAGVGDINFGTKSLMFDSELLQLTFQLRTFMPSGNFMNNLGTGQFVLDPSILTSLKLGPETYFQGQFGNWIPLGGPGANSKAAGGVFYWLMSVNQVLWYMTPESPLIATLEMDGWSFENGGYTPSILPGGKPHAPIPDGGGVSYFNIGPGLRQSIGNKLDFGGAITFATNTVHWAQPWFRFEVRFLF